MARKETPENPGRLRQIVQTYKMTKRVYPTVGLVVAAVGIAIFGVLLGIGYAIGHPVYAGILGFMLALLAMAFLFGRRAESAGFSQIEGQEGAARAVLDTVGRGWTVTTAVQFNRNRDMVHRAVGRAGIVLVAEGNPVRVKGLLANEKRKMLRVALGAPVTDIIVGNGEGEVPLKKVRTTMLKLPRTLPGPKVTEVNERLKALGDMAANAPIPKGPMPKSARMPKGGRGR